MYTKLLYVLIFLNYEKNFVHIFITIFCGGNLKWNLKIIVNLSSSKTYCRHLPSVFSMLWRIGFLALFPDTLLFFSTFNTLFSFHRLLFVSILFSAQLFKPSPQLSFNLCFLLLFLLISFSYSLNHFSHYLFPPVFLKEGKYFLILSFTAPTLSKLIYS